MDKENNGRVSSLFLTNLETKKEVQRTRDTETNARAGTRYGVQVGAASAVCTGFRVVLGQAKK